MARRHFNDEEIRNIGRRVRACRVLTGATQEEFASKHGFSYPSLKAWEFGKVMPRLEGIDKLISSWKNDGVFVQRSWIINGEGTGPAYRLRDVTNHVDGIEYLSSTDEELESIFRRRCKKLNQNPIFSTVDDEEMVPYFFPGDKIAGVMVELESASSSSSDAEIPRPILIKKSDGNFAPRWVHFLEGRSFIQSNTNRKLTEYLQGVIGTICWHAYAENFLAKK